MWTFFFQFWSPFCYYIIPIIAVFPITQTLDIALNKAFYIYVPALDGYATKTYADPAAILSRLIVFMIITTVLSASANIMSFVKLTCMKQKISGAERNLFFVSFCSFLVQLFAGVNTVQNFDFQVLKPSIFNMNASARQSICNKRWEPIYLLGSSNSDDAAICQWFSDY